MSNREIETDVWTVVCPCGYRWDVSYRRVRTWYVSVGSYENCPVCHSTDGNGLRANLGTDVMLVYEEREELSSQ